MALKNIQAHIQMNGNEIRTVKAEILASDPSLVGADEARFWYNSTDGKFRLFDGSVTLTFASIAEVQALVDASLAAPEPYDPTATGNFPTTFGGNPIDGGRSYRITVANPSVGSVNPKVVNVEDLLIALVDTPSENNGADWMVAESNRDQATESIKGVLALATLAEVNTGTDDEKALTPLKARQAQMTRSFLVNLDAADANVTRLFAGGETTFTVTHSLNTLGAVVKVYLISTDAAEETSEEIIDANNVRVGFNGNVASAVYRIVVVG